MNPKQQLHKFMAKYHPAIAVQAKNALAKMRKLVPGAIEMVYDNYNALVIGFVPGNRPSDAVFSIALYPKYLNLFFAHGDGLPDPTKRLQGEGKRVRLIRLESEATLDEPDVRALIRAATEQEKVRFDPRRKPRIEIRAVVKKQRPRRPVRKA